MNTLFTNDNPIILYRYELSGHCHRVQLMLSLLKLPFEIIDLERDGSNQPQNFLEVSPFGQVPVIDDNGFQLSDSNAIIVYLVKKYSENPRWLPDNAEKLAKVQRWLSIAAGELVSGPAIARFSKVFNVDIDHETAKKKAHNLLSMMDNILSQHDYLTGNEFNIADIALYTYVAHAPEGDIKLDDYNNIINWLAKIEGQNRFVAMKSA